MTDTHYYFYSWLRENLAAAIDQQIDTNSDKLRASIKITLNVMSPPNKIIGGELPEKTIELYGPGDVLGFDSRIITRTDPRHNVGDFEPNYFPIIEFADPDFPWRFTPTKENTSENLQPWIALIVLEDGEFKEEGTTEGDEQGKRPDKQLPPVISEVSTSSLPDLSETWRWAHVQVTDEANKEISDLELKKIMLDEPEQIISRLMCARRLKSGTKYHAFVVPTFRCGRSVGMGKEPDESETPLSYAWDKNCNKIELPYYYKWEFRTGQRGDFEHLIRLLKPRPITGVGTREIKCEDRGVITDPVLDLEGALCSPDTVFTQWGKDGNESEPFRVRLAELLKQPKADMAGRGSNTPKVVPPIYGRWHAARDEVHIQDDNMYLFSWDGIPGNDNEILIEFLKQKYGIDWVIKPKIDKIDNDKDKAIKVSTEKNNISLRLNDEKTKMNLEINDGRTDEFIVKTENGKLNIYDNINKSWLDELNLDPRHRIAASIGAKVIKDQQESLMISAWDQLGDVEEANEKLRQAQIGIANSKSIYKRLPQDEDLLRLTAPVFSKVQMENRYTVQEHIQRSMVPLAVCDPAFRRIQRPQGPIRKRQKVALTSPRLFERFNKGGHKVVRTHPVSGNIMENRTLNDTISSIYTELEPRNKIIDRTKRILERNDSGIIMAHPTFPQPMYKFLQDISQDLLLPGIEKIPPNTIGLLKTNRRFIEAYMCGLNHEFASELLWREYPTDQRGSYFRQFWDYSDYISKESDTEENLEDIKSLAKWNSERLGSNEPANHPKEKLVLILRGDLLKKYPNAVIYAVEAKLNEKNERVPALPEFEVEGEIQSPVFSGTMQPDITFLGFNITEDEARNGWYFVIEERVSETQFGLDEIKSENSEDFKSWDDLTWGHFKKKKVKPGDYLDGLKPDLEEEYIDEWNDGSANIAWITMQKPVRIIIHANRILP